MPGNTTIYSIPRIISDYIVNGSTTNGTYTTIGKLIFGGINNWGLISKINVLSYVESGATYGVRIYDTTNSLVIAEILNQSNASVAIVDLGVISNLSDTQAIWEAQIKRMSGAASKNVFLDTLSMEIV